MELTFLGVGSAFNVEQFQSNALLSKNGKNLLVDAGHTVQRALHKRFGYTHINIDAVFISHLHGDHFHGLEWLALSTYFDPRYVDAMGTKRRPKLFIRDVLVKPLWDSLKASLRIPAKRTSLETYFDVCAVTDEFVFEGTTFKLVQTVHYLDCFEIVPSYGLYFTGDDGRRVFFTSDTMYVPYLKEIYKMSDLVLHDCETSAHPTGVHAHFNELKTLAPEHKAKMWLYHFQSGNKEEASDAGFRGWIREGDSFDYGADTSIHAAKKG